MVTLQCISNISVCVATSDRIKLPVAHIVKIKVKHGNNSSFFVNPRCACTAGGLVCVFVTNYSGNTGHEEAHKRYKWLLSYEGKKNEKAHFP